MARHVRPSTFHGLSVAVVSSGRFHDALERIVRFAAVVRAGRFSGMTPSEYARHAAGGRPPS